MTLREKVTTICDNFFETMHLLNIFIPLYSYVHKNRLPEVLQMLEKQLPNKPETEFTDQELNDIVLPYILGKQGLQTSPAMLNEMMFIYLVAIFDAFLTDIFEAVLLNNPKMLKSGKQLSYERIIELQESNNLIPFLVRRELQDLSYESLTRQFDYYKTKFGINLENSKINVNDLIELRAKRNTLVHNAGIVDYKYLDMVYASDYSLGDKVLITEEYVIECHKKLSDIGTFLQSEILAKFGNTSSSL